MLSSIRAFISRLADRPPRDYRKLCVASKVIYLSLIPTAIVYLIARLSPAFSDFFNRYISQPLRLLYAKLTNFLPFSLAEGLLILLPVLLGFLLWHAVRKRTATRRHVLVYTAEILSIAVLLLVIFVWNFGVGYYTSPLDSEDKLDLQRTEVSAQQLYETALILVDKVNTHAAQVQYRYDDFSVMPYSHDEMNSAINIMYNERLISEN
jgi:hypothetical protein